MSVPCLWEIETTCCDTWGDYTETVRDSALQYATTVLWAATGRQFGVCVDRVRPCGRYDGSRRWIWGYWYDGGTWFPYVDAGGVWRNCGCGFGCSCEPRCQVWLPGNVESIIQVTVGAEIIDPTAYRVDNGQWLVRTDGDCWPYCGDLNVDSGEGFFEVVYAKGTEVPRALKVAAGILACEFAKACVGATCRLPGRIAQVARQGVSVNMVSLENLLRNSFTGIPEVDQLIQAYNPNHLTHRMRILTPDIPIPRRVTSA